MSIANFMNRDLITVTPSTKIFDCLDLMKAHQLHRLPVVAGEKGGDAKKLVGLITQGVIQAALPSTATSLSVFEVNYLLNKTTVGEVMLTDITTISSNAQLEDGIYLMRQNDIGVLPVVDDAQLVGIITNNDIFDAFLNIAAYFDPGLVVSIAIPQDKPGVLAGLTHLLAAENYSISTIMVLRKEQTIVELRLQTVAEKEVSSLLEENGYEIVAITTSTGK